MRLTLGAVLQALFGNLGSHKLGPQIEARAEVLQAEAGEDTTKQVPLCQCFSQSSSLGYMHIISWPGISGCQRIHQAGVHPHAWLLLCGVQLRS